MNTFELIIKGNVQRVGFRNIASRLVFELGLGGSIENLPDESVKIIIQGEGKKN